MNFRRVSLLFLFAACTLLPVRAIELRFINWDGDESELKFTNKGKVVTIHAAESSLSPVYTFDGPGPLVLFKEILVEGKKVRQPAATLAVPAGFIRAIVVIAATDATLTTYAGVWIDDAPETRPKGSIRLLNLSNHEVAFKVDASEFTLPPSGNHQVSAPSNVRRILMQAATQVNGKWEVVANNPLPVRSGLRLLLLLRDGRPKEGSETNIVDLLSFYDVPPEPPELAAISGTGK
jgi:hypothetical protein